MPTPDEARRIGHAISALRPEWLATSVQTGIMRNFPTRPARDVALALVVAAFDPTADTPGVLTKPGPWWTAADALNRGHSTPAATAEPICDICRHTVTGCAHAQAIVPEHLRYPHDFTPTKGTPS